MHFSNDSSKATKGRLGDSSLEDWHSFLENSPGEKIDPQSPASQTEPIPLRSLHRRALAVVFICWIAFLAAMVFGFILLTMLAIPARDIGRSSTVALHLENELGIWTARRLYCSASRPCDVWNPFSEDAPSNLRLEMPLEEPELIKC